MKQEGPNCQGSAEEISVFKASVEASAMKGKSSKGKQYITHSYLVSSLRVCLGLHNAASKTDIVRMSSSRLKRASLSCIQWNRDNRFGSSQKAVRALKY